MGAATEPWQAQDSVVIRAPAERIYETLRDYNNVGRVFGFGRLPRGYTTRIEGPELLVNEGSVVDHRIGRLFPFRFRRRVEALEPNRRIVERYIGPNHEGSGIWELEQTPGGVKVSYIYDAADTGWRSRLVHRITGDRMHHHFYSHGLERLKRKLEDAR